MYAKMKNFCLLLALFVMISSLAAGQGKKIINVPPKYFKPHENIETSVPEESTGYPWVVYSDRPGNKTYKDPDGIKVLKELNFLDWFYVVEEKESWIHIYKEAEGVDYNEYLSKNAVDFGWVDKRNMLLWKNCMFNENEIAKKAMVLNTANTVKLAIKKGESSMIKFYKDPKLQTVTDVVSNIFQVFFVYEYYPDQTKKDGATAVLLGTKERIDAGNPMDVIWGWVDINRIVSWDNRVAILPNVDPVSLAEREKAGIKAMVAADEVAAKKIKENQKPSDEFIIWKSDAYRKEYPGSYMRFPVLWPSAKIQEKKGVMKVGVMGQVQGEAKEMDHYDYANVKKNLSEASAKARNINLIFVVDGTSSMGPFFPKISEALTQAMNQLEDKSADKKITFRFGGLIYRDKAEGARLTEVFPLTSVVSDLSSKLQKVEAKDMFDKDKEEALFFGLKNAMRSLNVPADQTNFLVLIGDAGNHNREDDSQVAMKEIVDLMSTYKYNFLAFQVHNEPGSNAYSQFNSQAREILDEISQRAYLKSKQFAQSAGAKIPPPPKQRMDGNRRKYVMDNPSVLGSVSYCLPGQQVSPETLRKDIYSAITSFFDSTTIKLAAVNQIVNEGKSIDNAIEDANKKVAPAAASAPSGDKVDYFANGIWGMLENSGIPPENIAILKDEHYQMYIPGFTPEQTTDMKSKLWQMELFCTMNEFQDIRRSLQKLIEARNSNERRKAFQETWKQLLRNHLGEVTEDALNAYTLEQTQAMIFGLPGVSKFLTLRLADLGDPAKFPESQLVNYLGIIENKLKKLTNILGATGGVSLDQYSFESNTNRYYWIPQSLLP